MMDDTGTYEMLVAQRKRPHLLARMSQAARHAIMPTVYARPVPLDLSQERTRLDAENGRLRASNLALKARIKQLEHENCTLQAEVSLSLSRLERIARDKKTCRAILAAFVEEMKNHGLTMDGRDWTVEHFTSPRRDQKAARARYVAMHVCRKVCPSASSPVLGMVFGGRDHTTALAALKRAEETLETYPDLRIVAERTLARFLGKESESLPEHGAQS